ncbi:hypothetical protein TARUN_7009 [Trichoderma arundinaceum]|uniref:Uncharacterized protein n=1 Tax=Trichoderma arundinaceum TaxID=490622 RepID=A0A395NGJ3_TRIAR|nr:hypothetical protein TARUN_7009 [Trichoderma arundinaceum]
MADNTQNASGDRSSGISSGIIEEAIAISQEDRELMLQSGHSATSERKARKAKKEKIKELESDMEMGAESEGELKSTIRSSGISSGIIEEAIAISEEDRELMLLSGHSATSERKARKAKKEKIKELKSDIEMGAESEGELKSTIRSSGISSGIIEEAIAISEEDRELMLQSGHSATSERKARKAKKEKQESTGNEQ